MSDTAPWIRQTEVFTSGYGGYNTYRIPALAIATDGTLLAFCEGRKNSHYDWDEINIVLRRSTDGGATWQPMQVVALHGDDTAGNPCVVVDGDTGAVWLAYCRNNDQVYVTRSEDSGVSWSEPREITADVKLPGWTWYGTGPGHGIQLRSGRLLIPCDHVDGTRHDPAFFHSHVIYSDDHGSSWKLGGIVEAGSDECEVAETRPGHVYMTSRATAKEIKLRMCARSADRGETWSELEEAEGVIDPLCQGSVVALADPSGRDGETLLVLASLASIGRRQNMTLRLSRDEGSTWDVSKVLYPGVAAYSDLAVAPDNTICSLYERGVLWFNDTIVLAQFNLEWLTSVRKPIVHFRGNRVATETGWELLADEARAVRSD